MGIKKLIKLDIISIKPYFTLKNFIIMTVLALFYMELMDSPNVIMSITMIFSMIFSSYPFLVGENSGIDGLYRIFSIDCKDVVVGRYILAGLLYIMTSLIGLIFYLIITLIKSIPMNIDILITLAINFLVYAVVTALQYPIFFKYGYTKAKTYALIPIFIIGIIAMSLGFFIKDFKQILSFLEQNKSMILISVIILVVVIIFISIKLAIKSYKKRDF
ncbi:ABC-2 transporter permease [Anaerococcus sp. DFU013_CI05]|uniref:ABC-2 transporter permease n=1 Tax=Anaerococcus sp. AH8042_DFU013_CI05 TaxID=3385202 RepID=UPI003A523A05